MSAISVLNRVKEVYQQNGNIINYLKSMEDREENSLEDILISYDFQAGTYSKDYYNGFNDKEPYYNELAYELNKLGSCDVVLEAGVGEATTLGPILKMLNYAPQHVIGFDLSWSRIKYANNFLNDMEIENVILTTGDLLVMPIKSNSVDIAYTSHAVEPNGGKEKEILQELYRVSKRFVVLFEPAYELADEESRKRMLQHGYVTKLYETALELGYNVIKYKLLDNPINLLNPTGVLIIKKDVLEGKENEESSVLCCPITKTDLERIDGALYTSGAMLAYPIIQGIPCLLPTNAVIATKFND